MSTIGEIVSGDCFFPGDIVKFPHSRISRTTNMNTSETEYQKECFSRTLLALGDKAFAALSNARAAVFGVGGVGGWCAEALVRTGIGHIEIVDCDEIVPSNANRQVIATSETVGEPKVEALSRRLAAINPNADIRAVKARYCTETAGNFDLASFDYVIDAIDSVRDKALLVRSALDAQRPVLFSSMGAALRFDPTRVRATPFDKVSGDGLARALRKALRESGGLPAKKFTCVWSDEPPAENSADGIARGSLVQVTAVFGCTLAGLVVNDLRGKLDG